MTDAHPRAPNSGGPFIPRALVPVNVGRSTVNLYPIIDPSMATHERAHAYHINKTALSSQNIDLRVQLDALGHQLNLSAMVEGVINDWLRYFYDRWCDFFKLQILSFHNTKGDEVNDTTNTTDSSILLPVIDGAYGTCCKNVRFVRVQLSVNFVDLVTAMNPGPTTLRIEYFIELPQTTRQMTNGAGTVYNLTTFHGASELHTLDAQGVQREITDFTLQDGPVELQAASFGATSAQTESSAIRTEIQEKILRLASSSICHTMFTELWLCPGYSNQPHAALEHIRQVHNDKDGNPVSSSVQAYYQQLLNASRPFTRARIVCFSCLTVLVLMTLENGASHDLRSVILFRSTHLARWTAVSCLIFTFAILPTGATMQSTSVIGFNFTVVRTFFILRSPQIRTLFVHPTHPTNMQNAITSCLFGVGRTPTPSRSSPSVTRKHTVVVKKPRSLRQTATSDSYVVG